MSSPRRIPTVYVIAGPNGAGKTTFATVFLPAFGDCRQFLNADLIAAGLSPFAPETQNLRAGRLLLERIDELSAAGEDFGFETTLSGRTYVRLLTRLKHKGYRVILYFLWLPDDELAMTRVANRVRQGGHSVPEADIRRRYRLGLKNFFDLYRPCCDVWWLYDASQRTPGLIARGEDGLVNVEQPDLFAAILRNLEG
ncbi:zeta toxin family protein [Singulisphaera rosea]